MHSGACMSTEDKKCMPLDTGKVSKNTIEVLCDSGCSAVLVSLLEAEP